MATAFPSFLFSIKHNDNQTIHTAYSFFLPLSAVSASSSILFSRSECESKRDFVVQTREKKLYNVLKTINFHENALSVDVKWSFKFIFFLCSSENGSKNREENAVGENLPLAVTMRRKVFFADSY
jgi:hypothetical protein